jgi:hypothetical protein
MDSVSVELSFEETVDINVGGIRRVVGLVRLANLVSLISAATLESNPRRPKRNAIVESIKSELNAIDQLFTYKTRGLLIGAENVSELGEAHFELRLVDQNIEGILDGGHNTLAIGLAILESATHRNQSINRISDWIEFKRVWKENQVGIEAWATGERDDLGNMVVGIEFILPIDQHDEESKSLFRRSIIDICSARNTSSPLKNSTMLDKAGLLDPLKSRLDEHLAARIQWTQNGQGTVKADDLITKALVPFKVLSDNYPVISTSGKRILSKSPQTLYSSRGEAVNLYRDFMQSDTLTKRTPDYRRVVRGVEGESAFDIAAEIPKIYDLIYSLFADAFDSAGYGKLMDLNSIIKYNHRNRDRLFLPMSGNSTKVVFPEALIQPILRGLSVLLEFDSTTGRVKWRVASPEHFISSHMNEIVKPIAKAYIQNYSETPDRFGKDSEQIVYSAVEDQFRRFVK